MASRGSRLCALLLFTSSLAAANPLAATPAAQKLFPRQAATSTSVVPTIASVAGYKHLGCYEDGSNHILTVTSSFDTGMTPRLCRNMCAVAECEVFGVESAYNCWCGRSLEPFAASAGDQGECDVACRGAKADLCGGSARMNVYSATVDLSQISTATIPTGTGDSDNSDGNGAGSEGSKDGGSGSGSNSSSDTGGVAVGAVVGIAIGCSVLVALISGAIGAVFYRRLRNRIAPPPPADLPPSPAPSAPATMVAQKPVSRPPTSGEKARDSEPAPTTPSPPPPAMEPHRGFEPPQSFEPPSAVPVSSPAAAAQYAPWSQPDQAVAENAVALGSAGGPTVYGSGTPVVQRAAEPRAGAVEAHGVHILEAPSYVPYEMAANEHVGGGERR
ncbi:uncharacterized protein DNG_03506 [Cephalotrichum gorgonifer]|uniref:WSC domain-containing protein n=1 Tax=Cephalotrichum gorgonifer TaxID=2041049 RepID=A0AAE8MWV1_9PEZI|nr:uncharacterized protein DNG_03506 [Cephalotrichum gorgonifer]